MDGTPVAIGLGSNLGDRLGHLQFAVVALERLLTGVRLGPLFSSPPLVREATVGAQSDYLNSAAIGHSTLGPEELLAELKRVEFARGRRRGRRDAERPLDLDLLLYGDLVRRTPELTLPHAALTGRAFALAPLAAIAGEWEVPETGETVAGLLERSPDAGSLERITWPEAFPGASATRDDRGPC